jgi:hypothetical protein
MYGISIHHLSLLRQRDCRYIYCYRILPHPYLLQWATIPPLSWVDKRGTSPKLHYFLEFNSLAPYVKEKDTPLTNVLPFPRYVVLSSFLMHPFFLTLHQVHPPHISHGAPHISVCACYGTRYQCSRECNSLYFFISPRAKGRSMSSHQTVTRSPIVSVQLGWNYGPTIHI